MFFSTFDIWFFYSKLDTQFLLSYLTIIREKVTFYILLFGCWDVNVPELWPPNVHAEIESKMAAHKFTKPLICTDFPQIFSVSTHVFLQIAFCPYCWYMPWLTGWLRSNPNFFENHLKIYFFDLLSPKNINKFNILHLTHINDENTYHDSSPPKTDESRIFTKFLRFSPSKQWKYRSNKMSPVLN